MLKESLPSPLSKVKSTISFKRQTDLFIKYSLSLVLLYSLLVISSSLYSEFNWCLLLSKTKVTSAILTPFLSTLPAKTTSLMLLPRMFLADCSPNTHLMASIILLLPQPFGPTIPVYSLSNSTTVLLAKDLNPFSIIFFKNIIPHSNY